MPFPQSSNRTEISKGLFAPDVIEIVEQLRSRQTSAGYISPSENDRSDYVSTGISFPAYSYLATGRFLSTSVTPTEYGDRDALDSIMALIFIEGKTADDIAQIRPTKVVRLYRKGYTPESGKMYRLVTGNVYPTHYEYRLVPLPE